MTTYIKIFTIQLFLLTLFIISGEAGLSYFGVVPLLQNPNFADGVMGKLDQCQFNPESIAMFCDRAKKTINKNQSQILFLGGSSLEGYPHASGFSVPSQVKEFLDLAYPGKFAVTNLAKSCKDSFYFLSCAESYGLAGVKKVVIYDGHNDLINFERVTPRRLIFMAKHPAILQGMRFLQANSRIYAAINWMSDRYQYYMHDKKINLTRAEFLENQKVLADNYERNIESIIRLAERSGASVLLLTSVSNLSNSLPDPTISINSEAVWLFKIGKEAERAGNFEKANEYLRKAKDLALFGLRAPSEFNDRLKLLASRNSSFVELLDIEKILMAKKQRIGCNYFGDETYCDPMHPNKILKRKIAELVTKSILTGTASKTAQFSKAQ